MAATVPDCAFYIGISNHARNTKLSVATFPTRLTVPDLLLTVVLKEQRQATVSTKVGER